MLGKSSPALEQICLRTWGEMRAGAGQLQGAGKQRKPRALGNSECKRAFFLNSCRRGYTAGQWLPEAHGYDLSRACDDNDVNNGSDSNNNGFDDEN